MRELEFWMDFADKVFAFGAKLFQLPSLAASDAKPTDVKSVALMLVSRSLSNYQASRVLLDKGYIVEAEVLTRCCFENMFWITALNNRGDEFVSDMHSDNEAFILKQANREATWSQGDEPPNHILTWRHLAADVLETPGRRAAIRHLEAAKQGSSDSYYLEYGKLSAGAAHPSSRSLSRHLKRGENEGDFTISAAVEADSEDILDVLQLGTRALFFICDTASNILYEETDDEKEIVELNEEFGWLLDLHEEFFQMKHHMRPPPIVGKPLSKAGKKELRRRQRNKTAAKSKPSPKSKARC